MKEKGPGTDQELNVAIQKLGCCVYIDEGFDGVERYTLHTKSGLKKLEAQDWSSALLEAWSSITGISTQLNN